jgi:nitrite reductase/ring-hydroxylating ferredoxin subunit
MSTAKDPQKACAATAACAGAAALDRRRFLSIAGSSAGAALIGGAVSSCGGNDAAPFGKVAAGNVSALPVGTLLIMGNVIVARDDRGLYAMTAICTHMGCIVRNVSHTVDSTIHCPCHGSMYDGNGAVTQGPAPRSLQHYAVTVAADGSLTVDGDQPVSADARTAVA